MIHLAWATGRLPGYAPTWLDLFFLEGFDACDFERLRTIAPETF